MRTWLFKKDLRQVERTARKFNVFPVIFPRMAFMLLGVFIWVNQISATNIEITNRKYLYNMNTGTPSTMIASVLDPDFDEITGSTATFRDKKTIGYVQLGIDPSVMFCYDDYRRIEVVVGITYTKLNDWPCNSVGSADTTRDTTIIKTLIIDFDPTSQRVYTEQARILLENAYFIKLTVASVSMYDATNSLVFSGTSFSSLPEDIFFETGLQIERYYDLDYNDHPANLDLSLDGPNGEIVFAWDFMDGAEFYEIEFTYVNDYSTTDLASYKSTSSITTSFFNNATLVRLNNTTNEFRIPNVFDRGYVLARIRGIGLYSTDLSSYCVLENEIIGEWSFENTPSPFTVNTMDADEYIAVSMHEGTSGNNKNWKASASYAEDGKHKEIVEYADGSSRVRQSVTRLSSTNEAIVGETMYDYQGRPTVQILPVPVESQRIKYYDNFNLEHTSGDKFNREHFDDDAVFDGDACIPTAPQLKTTSGASYYYSPDNSFQSDQQAFVADAEKYPYTQVVYTPDNTGRIKMQSGVGANHILGSGHETKYFYGKPSQEELDRLFGTNVGYKSHYQKNMVIDANGQVSISFLDMAGKTIATSLAGTPPGSVIGLVDENGDTLYQSQAEEMTINLLGDVTGIFPNGEDNHLSVDGAVWSNTTPLLVESEQDYNFSYAISLVDYLDSCLSSVCFDCVYDLKIDILNSCNQSVSGFPYTIKLGADTADEFLADTLCNQSDTLLVNEDSVATFNTHLEVGNYTIIKTLSIDETVIGYYTEKFIEYNECLLDWEDFYQEPDTSGCFYDCADCLEALGDSTEFYAQYDSSGISLIELRNLWMGKKAMCDKICDDDGNDMCKINFRNMLRDLTPGGQYAKYDLDVDNNPTNSTDRLSVFNDDTYLPDFTNPGSDYDPPTGWMWRFPHYFNYDNPATFDDAGNEQYFEENGDTSRIYLAQDAFGNWIPEIIVGAPIHSNANGYYTYPQYLNNMGDFISRFKDSWAKSLISYHPEFLYLSNCIDITTSVETISSTDYNSWEYEKLLLSQNDYMDYSSVSAIIPTQNDFDLRENDPFFIEFGSTTLVGSQTVNDIFDLFADTYLILPAETLDIWEYAYVTEECNVGDPGFDGTSIGVTCATSVPMNNSDKSDYIGSKQKWDRIVGAYQGIKQKIFYILLNKLVNADNDITNKCIGAVYYDPNVTIHTVHPWLPCDLVEYYRYAQKDVRFGSPDAIYNDGTFDPSPPTPEQLQAYAQQQVYELTGKCPAAMDMQTFLNGLIQTNDLFSTSMDLTDYHYLMPVLKQKLIDAHGGVLPTFNGTNPIPRIFYWELDPSYYYLDIELPSGYDWNDVTYVTNVDDVDYSGGDYSFTVQAYIFGEWIEADGFTNIQIGNCEGEIKKPCKTTPYARDMKSLIAALKTNSDLNNTTFDLFDYYGLMTDNLKLILGSDGAHDYEWDNPSSGSYTLTNTNTSNYIGVEIDPGDVSMFSTGSFSVYSISGDLLTSTFSSSTSHFILYGYTDLNDQLLGLAPDVEIHGNITYNGEPDVFPVSDCSQPVSIGCNTTAHQNYNDLLIAEGSLWKDFDCFSHLENMQGEASTAPDSAYIWVVLNDQYNNSAGNSHVFLYTYDPSTFETDTFRAVYCKPLAICNQCTYIGDDGHCDAAYFSLFSIEEEIDSAAISEGAIFTIGIQDFAECKPDLTPWLQFIPSVQMSPPFTIERILRAWADTINAHCIADSVRVYYSTASGDWILSMTNLGPSDCSCNPSVLPYFKVSKGDSIYYANGIEKHCCDTYVPCYGYISVNYKAFDIDTSEVDSSIFKIELSSDIAECHPLLDSLLTFIPLVDMAPGTYTKEDILSAWADSINAYGSLSTFYATTYDDYFTVYLFDLFDVSCPCEPGNPMALMIIEGDTTSLEGVKLCCVEPKKSVALGHSSPSLLESEAGWEEQETLVLTGPCDMNATPFDSIPQPTNNPCVDALVGIATMNANNAYEAYLDSVRAAFRSSYIAQCMGVTESFQTEFINKQYHFTLYYYDQAGNLVKTVPPLAVKTIAPADWDDVKDARNGSTTFIADHDDVSGGGTDEEHLTTKYVYNTLNQPRYQKTPDGGETEFIYDALGRLTMSQNEKQRAMADHVYSYTTYDALGRITEVGQTVISTAVTQDYGLTSIDALPIYIALTSVDHTQITTTLYDVDVNIGYIQTENCRNRVSYTLFTNAYGEDPLSATGYSYDVHGNVKKLYQYNSEVPGDSANKYKVMNYEYDLVSGKVNKVIYQEGKQDQWIHRYSYDADNRLTDVYTSRDDVFYDRDASYFYYKHGPLARTELGQNNVQGVDYTYTIHGWLKAVNATNLDRDLDIGKDGAGTGVHQYFTRDAYSYALEYFDEDYKNISANTSFKSDISPYWGYFPEKSLYNGNIRLMQTTVKDNGGVPIPILSVYNYDQLNRLVKADYNADFDLGANSFGYSSDQRYENSFSYDANGNILTQMRKGEIGNLNMDDLEYHYITGTNKLDYIDDGISSSYTDDIDDQSSGNYTYDEIGNLVSDNQEEISGIHWSVYGKVLQVDRYIGSRPFLYFSYGPGGQRITKRVDPQDGPEVSYYYFHDASGNVMGIYKYENDSLYLEEHMIYGSTRVGSLKLHEPANDEFRRDTTDVTYIQTRGQKRYELSNHLGNVLTTITDRRALDCDSNWYNADIVSVSDYSAFGAPLAGDRTWSTGDSYRFGFNGMEKDNEVSGQGNSYTAEFWQYDSRLGRRWNIDPMFFNYPWQAPYSTFNNCPLILTDKNGLEAMGGEKPPKEKKINFIIVAGEKTRKGPGNEALRADFFWAKVKEFFSFGKTRVIEVEDYSKKSMQDAVDEMVDILTKGNAKIGSIINDNHGHRDGGDFTFMGAHLSVSLHGKSDAQFNLTMAPLAGLVPFIDDGTKIMLGNCNAGLDKFNPVLVKLSDFFCGATVYAHMSYCMSGSLFTDGSYSSLNLTQLAYSGYIGDESVFYTGIGTWKTITSGVIGFTGETKIDYWGNIKETKKSYYADGDRQAQLQRILKRIASEPQ